MALVDVKINQVTAMASRRAQCSGIDEETTVEETYSVIEEQHVFLPEGSA